MKKRWSLKRLVFWIAMAAECHWSGVVIRMEKKSCIQVLVVDDHPVAREGIKNLLQKAEDIACVGEASGGHEALRLAQDLSPDVMVLDMELPDMNGVSVAKKLSKDQPSIRILVLSAHDGKSFIANTLDTGVAGYLTKDEAPESLIEAVRGVAQGKCGWISRRVAARMTDVIRDLKTNQQTALTDRERQVLKGVMEGNTNKKIGYALGVHEKTVEKHLEHIYDKLEVTSRVEAAVLAIREEIMPE
jgi:DNA-binding NarL/FixJ family response regulator